MHKKEAIYPEVELRCSLDLLSWLLCLSTWFLLLSLCSLSRFSLFFSALSLSFTFSPESRCLLLWWSLSRCSLLLSFSRSRSLSLLSSLCFLSELSLLLLSYKPCHKLCLRHLIFHRLIPNTRMVKLTLLLECFSLSLSLSLCLCLSWCLSLSLSLCLCLWWLSDLLLIPLDSPFITWSVPNQHTHEVR